MLQRNSAYNLSKAMIELLWMFFDSVACASNDKLVIHKTREFCLCLYCNRTAVEGQNDRLISIVLGWRESYKGPFFFSSFSFFFLSLSIARFSSSFSSINTELWVLIEKHVWKKNREEKERRRRRKEGYWQQKFQGLLFVPSQIAEKRAWEGSFSQIADTQDFML